MSLLRRLPTARLVALTTGALVALAAGTALAAGAFGSGGGPTPPRKSLAAAIHDAVGGPKVVGITARIRFTDKLVDSSSVGGAAGPLIAGATGRLWAAADGRVRVELQSDHGDAQIVSDGRTVTLYDASSNTAYELTLPADPKTDASRGPDAPATVGAIQRTLDRLSAHLDLSGATPDDVAGREAYTVKASPAHDGGLIGAAQLAFDAANGTPLRAAIYAAGTSSPVLELTATDIGFGSVAPSDLQASPPAGAKIVKVGLPSAGTASRHSDRSTQRGTDAVAAALPFALKAPDTLVGLPRKGVRLVSRDGTKLALVTYGAGLGGVAVLEQTADADPAAAASPDRQLSLPKLSIEGTEGQELATALGTLVRFKRAGVQYTIVGSVPPAAAEAAARGL